MKTKTKTTKKTVATELTHEEQQLWDSVVQSCIHGGKDGHEAAHTANTVIKARREAGR